MTFHCLLGRSITSSSCTWLLSRLTTLGQAVGDDEGFEVKVIDEEAEVGKGKSEEAEGE